MLQRFVILSYYLNCKKITGINRVCLDIGICRGGSRVFIRADVCLD